MGSASLSEAGLHGVTSHNDVNLIFSAQTNSNLILGPYLSTLTFTVLVVKQLVAARVKGQMNRGCRPKEQRCLTFTSQIKIIIFASSVDVVPEAYTKQHFHCFVSTATKKHLRLKYS
jgi:hypothetical protein